MALKKRTHDDLVKACLDVLELHGIVAGETDTSKPYKDGKRFRRPARCPAGWPDIVGFMPGRGAIAVECKVGKDTVSTAQHYWLERIRHTGNKVVVVRDSVDALIIALSPPKEENYP